MRVRILFTDEGKKKNLMYFNFGGEHVATFWQVRITPHAPNMAGEHDY